MSCDNRRRSSEEGRCLGPSPSYMPPTTAQLCRWRRRARELMAGGTVYVFLQFCTRKLKPPPYDEGVIRYGFSTAYCNVRYQLSYRYSCSTSGEPSRLSLPGFPSPLADAPCLCRLGDWPDRTAVQKLSEHQRYRFKVPFGFKISSGIFAFVLADRKSGKSGHAGSGYRQQRKAAGWRI